MKLSQKEQKERFIKLGNLVKEAGHAFSRMLSLENEEESYDAVMQAEDLGDDIQAELDAHFSTQKNAPYLTLERAKLLRRIDDTLDNFSIVARTLHVFLKGMPDDFPEKTRNLADLIRAISQSFADAVEALFTNFAQALKICGKIEENRDKIIEMTFDIEANYFYSLKGEESWKLYTAVERVMKRTAAAVQRLKDGSEVIELMVYKFSSQ